MALWEKIDQDLRAAMGAKNEIRLSTLRFLKSAIKYSAIEKKAQVLSDSEVRQVIQRQIKQRRESIDQFEKGGRAQLAVREKEELGILESYLPDQLSDKQLEEWVASEIRAAGAASKKDFGRMMKLLAEKLSGRAEPRRVSDILGRMLS